MLSCAIMLLRGIRKDRRGVAYLEFALTLPIILLLALGGLELTNLALAHLQVSQVAVTTADNAGRVPVQMDETDIDEVFEGARVVGESLGLENNGKVVLSSLQDNGKKGNAKGQTIRWQRCFGKKNKAPAYGKEGKGKADASMKDGMGPPGRRIAALPGTGVMYVEVTYDYDPIAFGALIGTPEIRYESAFNVRERTELGITNTKGKPVKSC